MLRQIVFASVTIGLFYMMFITPVYFSLGVVRMEYGDMFSMSDRIKCMIPIFNIMFAERLYTGKISKVFVSTIMFIVLTALRFVVVFMFPSNYILNVVTIVLFLLSLVLMYIANIYAVFIVINDAGVMSLPAVLIRSFIYPLGQWYIGSYLVTVIKNYKKGNNVFNGKN